MNELRTAGDEGRPDRKHIFPRRSNLEEIRFTVRLSRLQLVDDGGTSAQLSLWPTNSLALGLSPPDSECTARRLSSATNACRRGNRLSVGSVRGHEYPAAADRIKLFPFVTFALIAAAATFGVYRNVCLGQTPLALSKKWFTAGPRAWGLTVAAEPSYSIDMFAALDFCRGGQASGSLSVSLGPPPVAILNASGVGATVDFVASECSLTSPFYVNIGATAGAPSVYGGGEVAHSLPLGTPITRTILISHNFFVATDGGLELIGTRSAAAFWRPEAPEGAQGERTAPLSALWDAAPIDINIANNVFGVRNVLRFLGALPCGSSLRITDNRFSSVWALSADQPFSGASAALEDWTKYSAHILVTHHASDPSLDLVDSLVEIERNAGNAAYIAPSTTTGSAGIDYFAFVSVRAGYSNISSTSPFSISNSQILISENSLTMEPLPASELGRNFLALSCVVFEVFGGATERAPFVGPEAAVLLSGNTLRIRYSSQEPPQHNPDSRLLFALGVAVRFPSFSLEGGSSLFLKFNSVLLEEASVGRWILRGCWLLSYGVANVSHNSSLFIRGNSATVRSWPLVAGRVSGMELLGCLWMTDAFSSFVLSLTDGATMRIEKNGANFLNGTLVTADSGNPQAVPALQLNGALLGGYADGRWNVTLSGQGMRICPLVTTLWQLRNPT